MKQIEARSTLSANLQLKLKNQGIHEHFTLSVGSLYIIQAKIAVSLEIAKLKINIGAKRA